jgi:predicted component of viral defense system (DUF524 family)
VVCEPDDARRCRDTVKQPSIRPWGETAELTGDVLVEWHAYLVTAEGADTLRVGTEDLRPFVEGQFRLRFENRLGFAIIQPIRKGAPWGAARRLEIVSTKVGGYEKYRAFTDALISSLHRHGAEKVFDLSGMTAMGAGGPLGERSLLFVMHCLLAQRSTLLDALDLVCERPHVSLVERREVRRLASLSRGGKDLIDALLRGRGGWDRADHLVAGAAMGGFLPSQVEAAQGWESADNVENRFVLALVKQIVDLIELIQRAMWWRKVPNVRRSILVELQYDLICRAEHPLFTDVGRMMGLPSQSRVLTRREGYRQLFGCWSMLNEAVAPLLTRLENAIELRDVDLLYEQWCFFEMAERIGDALKARPHFEVPVRVGPLAWNARAEYPDGSTLVYNKTQAGYSLPFRPDLLWCVDGKPIAVFDAKFRAEVPKDSPDWTADPRRADLDKMHAYRDALSVASATVLYPGSEPWGFAAGSGPSSVTLEQLLAGWNGVAAMPLRPEVGNAD